MSKIRIKDKKVIDCSEWDRIVQETYNRPYCFQQQDGCKERGTFGFNVPDTPKDFENDTISDELGVSFKAWLARDPKQKLSNPDKQDNYWLTTWWERVFYPDIQMIANDLHSKGILKAGEYVIDIDW